MNNEIKENWFNGIRCQLSYLVASIYQKSWILLYIPILGDLIMDFLWYFSKWLSPFPTYEGCIDSIMMHIIIKRSGIPEEEFYSKLNEIRENGERESLGLPKKKRSKDSKS